MQDLVDNLEVVIAHLRDADTAPEVYTNVLGTLWQANVVVEQVGAAWINSELESAYSNFAALEHPDELASDGQRDQWRRASDHVIREAEPCAASARQQQPDASEFVPLARATEVMAYQLAEGIPIT